MRYPFKSLPNCLVAIALGVFAAHAAADLKIGVMQAQKGDAEKFKPLIGYLNGKGIEASLVTLPGYSESVKMFASGRVDAMFSGSGVAGILMIKELAKPLVRPVSPEGHSTYWATVVAPSGVPGFNGEAAYFNGKRIAFTSLASSGEIFYRAIPGISKVSDVTVMRTASHGAALNALTQSQAQVAIIKNRVWDKEKSNYPNLVQVGEDKGENPDNTLMVSVTTDEKTVSKLTDILLAMNDDKSAQAEQVRSSLGMKSFVRTTTQDFRHTLKLLHNAGVDEAFGFVFPN